MELTLPPEHALFHGFDPEKLEQYQDITVALGINPAFADRLTGTGNVPCWVCPRLKSGGYAGMASGPGFVVALNFEDLRLAGFAEADIWSSLGANQGTWADHTQEGKPVCGECITADNPSTLMQILEGGKVVIAKGPWCEPLSAEEINDLDPEDLEDLYRLTETPGPCWSCVEMIAEDLDRNDDSED